MSIANCRGIGSLKCRLATVNARTVEEIKSFLGKQKDNYRIPYEVHPEDRSMQCIFVGTSNTLDFLPLDRTGNRRFAPITVHMENVEKHILEDERESREYINLVWAEMMDFYRKNEARVPWNIVYILPPAFFNYIIN